MLAGGMTETVEAAAGAPRLWSGSAAMYALLAVGLVILVNSVVTMVRLFSLRRWQWSVVGHFPGPKPHWLYGNLKELLVKNVDALAIHRRWVGAYRNVMKMHLSPWKINIRLTSPSFIKTILSTSEPKDPDFYGFLSRWIGDGLLVSRGKKWARNRRLLTPAFHFDILRPYTDVFSECANTMVNKWKRITAHGESVEMFDHVSLMTLDSLLKCIFGTTTGCQETVTKHPYIGAVYEMADLILQRFRFFPYHVPLLYHMTYSGFRFRRACRVVHDYSRKVIKNKQADKSSGVKVQKKYIDFIDILMDARDTDGVGLTDKEIQEEVDTFMFEGHDTTASGISWCLYNLARHPEYQTRAREEVMDLMGERDNVTWDDMGQLPYLTQCIKESLRLVPPVPNTTRVTTREHTLPDGKIIPKDIGVTLAIYSVHHNPDAWSDPETYDPDRFSPEAIEGRSSHAYIPFAAGPRNCIGQHFAMNELKTSVAVVLKNFILSVDSTRPVMPTPALVIRATHGIWLKVTPVTPVST